MGMEHDARARAAGRARGDAFRMGVDEAVIVLQRQFQGQFGVAGTLWGHLYRRTRDLLNIDALNLGAALAA